MKSPVEYAVWEEAGLSAHLEAGTSVVDYTIRPARRADASGISRVIISTLRNTSARDYSEAVITRVVQNFTPAAVSDLLARRFVFVAKADDEIVGTASLDGRVVRTVFVEPAYQGLGMGRALMASVVREAVERGVTALAVPSSITAEPFYAKLGFEKVREQCHEGERTIIMERSLRSGDQSSTGRKT